MAVADWLPRIGDFSTCPSPLGHAAPLARYRRQALSARYHFRTISSRSRRQHVARHDYDKPIAVLSCRLGLAFRWTPPAYASHSHSRPVSRRRLLARHRITGIAQDAKISVAAALAGEEGQRRSLADIQQYKAEGDVC